MPTNRQDTDRVALLQGTLDLLILKTLVLGPHHGQGIARTIQRQSEEAFAVDPARCTWRCSAWRRRAGSRASGARRNNRRARFYTLTRQGRAQLGEKATEWRKLARAIGLILGPELGEAD